MDRLPQPLDCANLAKEWPKWKQQLSIYLMAANKEGEPENKKIATFLWLIGERGVEIYNTLFTNASDENMFGERNDAENPTTRTLKEVVEAFDKYCTPQKNVAMEAFKFNRMAQSENQPFVEYETALRTQLAYCDFECKKCHHSYAERMLRDKIVIGIRDKEVQLKLLDRKDDSLEQVIETCKMNEVAKDNRKLLEQVRSKEICGLETAAADENQEAVNALAARKTPSCFNCGQPYNSSHRQQCPAKNVNCNACGRIGHFKRYCRLSKSRMGRQVIRKVEEPQANHRSQSIHSSQWSDTGRSREKDSNQKNQNVLSIYKVHTNTGSRGCINRWLKRYRIQNQDIEFKLDTGADVNCISLKEIKKLKVNIEKRPVHKIVDYSSNRIKIHGVVKLECVDPEKKTRRQAQFLVVDEGFEPVLGLKTCIEFGLIKRLNVIKTTPALPDDIKEFVKNNKDIFEGLGMFPGTCSIMLKQEATPCLHYKKRIPFSLHERVRKELNTMVESGIISQVDYPTDWVNNMQVVDKPNGSMRICLDPKPLNACIKREHFLIPKPEDILSRLAGKRIFTVLDLRNGFWQMKLDRASSDLTTFMTPFGRYRWNRVPFGICSAPEMFQKRMVQIFGDIPGVEIYFDDLAIAGNSEKDHDQILSVVMERARKNQVKFNPEKTQYRRDKVKFMGYVISSNSIEPNRSYIKAITDMPKPQNKSEVLRLLGLVKYIGKFIPNLSRRTAALRNLSRDNVEFQWTREHDNEVQDIMRTLTTSPALAMFDPDKSIIIQTDSSKDGLGSVIMQDGAPVAYASRTLSKSEQKWAQIEKELLAIVFACERFHHLLYGVDFTVQSDHKPLEALVKRDIDDVTPRLQRMFLRLLKYPGLRIVYTPGKDMLVADCLSRAPLIEEDPRSEELSGLIHQVVKRVCLSADNHELYIQKLNNSEKYRKIVEFVKKGWPSYHQLDDLSQQFYKHKDSLHFEEGLLLKDHRLVIPTELQKTILKWLHGPHLGIEKTLSRARLQFFWPCMSNDITELVKGCAVCEKFARNNQKEPLVQDRAPEYPFQKVGIDLYEYGGKDYIVIMDAYSGYIISENIPLKSATSVIEVLDRNFCRLGYPTQIRCDNVPFNSKAFDDYANKSNIQFVYSSPRYPQSNGLAEKGVAIAKNLLKRCFETGQVGSFQYRLLEYNTTVVPSTGFTPTQLFFGRQLKTQLPTTTALLKRMNITEAEAQRRIEGKRRVQKNYYDRAVRKLPKLENGERIIFKKNSQGWQYGRIARKVNEGSYIIQDYEDNHYRRNRKFIKKSMNKGHDGREEVFEKQNVEESVRAETAEEEQLETQARDRPLEANISITEPLVKEEPRVTNDTQGERSQQQQRLTASPNTPQVASRPGDSSSEERCSNSPYRTRSGRRVEMPNRFKE